MGKKRSVLAVSGRAQDESLHLFLPREILSLASMEPLTCVKYRSPMPCSLGSVRLVATEIFSYAELGIKLKYLMIEGHSEHM